MINEVMNNEFLLSILSKISPAIILYIGAILMLLIKNNIARGLFALLVVSTASLYIYNFMYVHDVFNNENGLFLKDFASLYSTLTPTVHNYSYIFSTVFLIALTVGIIYSYNIVKKIELSSVFIYAGSALGIIFASNWISFFIYWELMAIASTIIVWFGSKDKNIGIRYAVIHFIGGLSLLIGIVIIYNFDVELMKNAILFIDNTKTGITINNDFNDIFNIGYIFILIGVLINTGAPPFSSWLSESYPSSSISGAVFLSTFTTKTSVFVLLTLFAGNKILITIGLIMVFYGIIYAILENNVRKILSYSIINQVGFMIVGVGIGTELSMNGAAAHAFCHIIYKSLLFMSAGSVILRTGKHKCTELGGIWGSMKITAICGIIGALAISAFPYTSGFVSKSMISTASHLDSSLGYVWWLLMAATAGVFLHAGIKFPWFVFFQKDSGLKPKEAPYNMIIAMIILSALCILPGFFPEYLYKLLPSKVSYDAYAGNHTMEQLQLLTSSALVFFIMLPLLKRTDTISIEFDIIYRKWGLYILQISNIFISFIYTNIRNQFLLLLNNFHNLIIKFDKRVFSYNNFGIGITSLYLLIIIIISLLIK